MIKPIYELEVSKANDKVWVHCSDGSTVGRFGRFGVDIHNTITDQLNGAPECRLCTHGQVSELDWQLFIEKCKEFWGVDVPYSSINKDIIK